MYGVKLTDKEIPALAQEIHALTLGKSSDGVNVHRLAKKMDEQGEKVFRYLNDNVPADESADESERLTAVIDEKVGWYLDKISGTISDLSTAFVNSRVQKLYEERKSKALWRLSMMGDKVFTLRKPDRFIHWLEKSMEGATKTDAFCAVPKDLDANLYDDLWSNGIPMILTSGTLSASGDFTRAKETLGLDYMRQQKLFDTTMPSPFDYKNNTMLYISDRIPFPDNKDKDYVIAVADEVERLVRASHGRAAVLFTSYNAMGQVHAILKNRSLPFPLFRLERGVVHGIEQFKKSSNGILMASGALWEGIDIPGDTLSMLIIVKLPFAVPDPIGDYERSLCGDMATYKTRAIIPDMLVKLKQGFGRLIRSENDTGVCAILDSRVNMRGAYRSRVLSALPECNVTPYISAVRDFYKAKKPAAYFLSQNLADRGTNNGTF
jgi:ATP-dependent DNA helicase DinG